MKIIHIILTILNCVCLAQCHEKSVNKKMRFDVTAYNDEKIPIGNADIRIAFVGYAVGDQKVYEGKTNSQGHYGAKDTVSSNTILTLSKNGYYPVRKSALENISLEEYQKISQINIVLTIREIKNPIPLYGRVVKRAIPEQNKPIGYDFKIADWVKPYGKGENVDIYFNYTNKCIGLKNNRNLNELIQLIEEGHQYNPASKESYFNGIQRFYETSKLYSYEEGTYHSMGHWQGNITLTFPNEKEGIIEVKDQFCHYSELTLPHAAPEDGYRKEWKREEDNNTNRKTVEHMGYFLRTRVKLDEEGNIVSANYTKLITDIDFDPRGRIEFSYLFNPTPNDRNLEFDTKKNLFTNLGNLESIRKP